jgi:serine/threonine protein kinase
MHDRDAFLAIMRAIHSAGVHHGDLRYENLLINDSGEVAIIDLDRATLNASESARNEEYKNLCRLLDIKVDNSVHEDVNPEGRNRTRIRTDRGSAGVQKPGRLTRSMGTTRQTLSGMTLRPRH